MAETPKITIETIEAFFSNLKMNIIALETTLSVLEEENDALNDEVEELTIRLDDCICKNR